jgi:DNA-binding HxlR family transcriptional regulator
VTGDSHRPSRSGCAINAAIAVLGDPWSMLAPREVIFGGRRHLRELLHGSKEGIASTIASSRLNRPVAAGLPTREQATHGQPAA